MAELKHFTDHTFVAEVLESAQPVLVDFTAEWCQPCQRLAPVVEALNREWAGVVTVGRLDIDANTQTTLTYGVMGLPTLILFKRGKPVERLTGYVSKEHLVERLKPHLGLA